MTVVDAPAAEVLEEVDVGDVDVETHAYRCTADILVSGCKSRGLLTLGTVLDTESGVTGRVWRVH